MKNLALTLVLAFLPIALWAFDFQKLALTLDHGTYWNTTGFKDACRLYTFRKDLNGDRRQARYFSNTGLSYRHVTNGGILVLPSLSFGSYKLNEERKLGLGGSLLVSQYTFQTVQRYASLSVFQAFGKEENSFLKSASLGLLFSLMESRKGRHIHGVEMGVGFSLMHTDDSFIPGIHLKANSLTLWVPKAS